MLKQEFLYRLKAQLKGLPEKEVFDRICFYEEMIDDRIEEGKTEEDAVNDIGTVEEVAAQILKDIPLSKVIKEKIKPKRNFRVWEIILIALGSPIWLSLLIAAVAVAISLYAVLWSLVITLFAVEGSFIGGALGGVIAGVGIMISGNSFTSVILLACAIVCAGLAVFTAFACRYSVKVTVLLIKKIFLAIKKCLIKKERAQ